jgi:CRP/FNR family transcriptional regulator, cyclic AMP receptor protein
MKMRSIADYLSAHPFFTDLDAASTHELAGCAVNEHIRAREYLFREGRPADHFYIVTRGRIALELFTRPPGRMCWTRLAPGRSWTGPG